jgi:phospholipase C
VGLACSPLGLLGKSLLFGFLAVAHDLGKPVPAVTPEDTITGSQAIAIGHDILGELFPAMHD